MFKNGKKASSEYSADCDDKVATVHGNVGILAPVAQKRVGPNIVEARYFKGLQVVATSRRVVSQDGNTLVITTVSSSPEGKFAYQFGGVQEVRGFGSQQSLLGKL